MLWCRRGLVACPTRGVAYLDVLGCTEAVNFPNCLAGDVVYTSTAQANRVYRLPPGSLHFLPGRSHTSFASQPIRNRPTFRRNNPVCRTKTFLLLSFSSYFFLNHFESCRGFRDSLIRTPFVEQTPPLNLQHRLLPPRKRFNLPRRT